MSPLRARMIDAMTLAGLAKSTQDSYVKAVRRLATFYRRSPDELSEEEVRAYLLDLRRRGAARGTFEVARAGLRFLFCQTLDRVWALFGEKKEAHTGFQGGGDPRFFSALWEPAPTRWSPCGYPERRGDANQPENRYGVARHPTLTN